MLKCGVHVHQQVRFKIHLVLERCCFEEVLPRRRLCPLGVKNEVKDLFLTMPSISSLSNFIKHAIACDSGLLKRRQEK